MKSELPQHRVELSEYFISRYSVTVGQFKAFVKDSGYKVVQGWNDYNNYDNHPVVAVSWEDAIAYCEWLTDKLRDRGWKIELPTEAQWEKAARGIEGRIYPWGDEFDSDKANTYETGIGTTNSVGAFLKGNSVYNLSDMCGNVWEWCKDHCEFDEKSYMIMTDTYQEGIKDPLCMKGALRVFRGGAWGISAWLCRSAYRYPYSPGSRITDLGFRLAFSQCQQV